MRRVALVAVLVVVTAVAAVAVTLALTGKDEPSVVAETTTTQPKVVATKDLVDELLSRGAVVDSVAPIVAVPFARETSDLILFDHSVTCTVSVFGSVEGRDAYVSTVQAFGGFVVVRGQQPWAFAMDKRSEAEKIAPVLHATVR